MKIYVAKFEPGRIGGGWSFQDNFYRGMDDLITTDFEEADIYFIASPSMVERADVKTAKDMGKKVVLRLDNAVRNSRNRNTGMTRMYDFAQWADLLIFQSHWAREYLVPFLKRDGEVVLNGTDIETFKPSASKPEPFTVLYSRFNRDETKNYEVARYWFSRYFARNPRAYLHIVGQFSNELREGNFDFYNGETYRYWGVLDKQKMADLYRSCEQYLYTYFNDACSNTLIEALCSGCEVVGDSYYLDTGGAGEIMSQWIKHVENYYNPDARHIEPARQYFSIERMCAEYKELIGKL